MEEKIGAPARVKSLKLDELKSVIVLIIATLFYSLTTYIFVLDNDFAPSGLSGVLAMIEKKYALTTGSFVLLLINAPLLVWSFFSLSKRFAIYTTLSVTLMCITFFLLDKIEGAEKLRFFDTVVIIAGESYFDFGRRIFCAVISGFSAGVSIAAMFRINASLGGVDIIVALVQKKKPRANVSILLFAVNAIVIIASYFVFDDIEGVLLSLIYIIIFSKVCEYILNGVKKALKFEVVTEHPVELSKELMEKLGHSVTVTHAKGMYQNKDKYLLICVIRSRQVADFEKVLKNYPDTFAFASSVSEVFGMFNK